MRNLFDFSAVQVRDVPFACFSAERILSEQIEMELLDWLEHDAKWQLSETDFYEQYEIRFCDIQLPPRLQPLIADATVALIRDQLTEHLGLKLAPNAEITAHRLDAGQTIRIHNDYRPNGEVCRFLIQLNRGWSDNQGGFLMLFRGSEPESLESIISPQSGSAFGFRISKNSHHAVSKVYEGQRFTMVFSFYEAAFDGQYST